MALFNNILSNISQVLTSRDSELELLMDKMRTAMEEEKKLWMVGDNFIEPSVITNYQHIWKNIYITALRKKNSFLISISSGKKEFLFLANGFINSYDSLFNKLHQHNEETARRKIDYVGGIINPVEGRNLDKQQIMCVAKEVRNHLVLAGAGTGKTTAVIGYIKYLLLSKRCTPEEVLVLSFTNASAAEMAQRITAETGYELDASTFHKLGMNIISAVEGKKPRITTLNLAKFIRSSLDELVKDMNYLQKLCFYLCYSGQNVKNEFEFSNMQEYEEYLKSNPPMTLNGEQVKSYGEMNIANFLFRNGIEYVYEATYPVDTSR